MARLPLEARILAPDKFGGYLIYRFAGARKVYFASAAPPVRFPNVYGIDMPTRAELIGAHRNEDEIRREIGADAILKATKVDGVYDKDPKKHADAVRYEKISYSEVLTQNLRVMDASAVAMCRDNNLPITVFDLNVRGNIMRMAMGEPIGTLIA